MSGSTTAGSHPTRCLAGVLAAAGALLCACSGGTSAAGNTGASASGATIKNLSAGRLDTLPTGAVYIQVNQFAQPPGGVIGSKKHVAGMIMQEKGVQRLEVEGSPPLDIHAGESDFLPSVTHAHLNPGNTTNLWYNFALWPTSARSAPLTSPGATVAFTTPDLPAGALPQGAYAITLQMVTIRPHGRTQAHSYGGVDVVFVLGGSISAHADGRAATTLSRGGASWALAGTGLQEVNDGDQPATLLSFVIAPVGQPFETDLTRAVA
jgi:quercetin dioxygenase-like cupin family protein